MDLSRSLPNLSLQANMYGTNPYAYTVDPAMDYYGYYYSPYYQYEYYNYVKDRYDD